MFGLYTINVKLQYKEKTIAILYRKSFLFQKSAEEFAEEIDEVQVGVRATANIDNIDSSQLKALITISDRSQTDYYFKKVFVSVGKELTVG